MNGSPSSSSPRRDRPDVFADACQVPSTAPLQPRSDSPSRETTPPALRLYPTGCQEPSQGPLFDRRLDDGWPTASRTRRGCPEHGRRPAPARQGRRPSLGPSATPPSDISRPSTSRTCITKTGKQLETQNLNRPQDRGNSRYRVPPSRRRRPPRRPAASGSFRPCSNRRPGRAHW